VPARIELACIVLDCSDPSAMAAFYQAAGGGEITHEDADSAWVTLAGTTLVCRRVDDYRPPTWPSPDVPLQVHMDFFVTDLREAERDLLAHGATPAAHQPHPGALLIMLDPAGHPFCLGVRPPLTA
jgi:hypothetical protein